MNLIEAIKTGKSFRRPGSKWIDQNEFVKWHTCEVKVEDLMADDWEVLSEVKIAEKDFWTAIKKARISMELGKALAKELGLYGKFNYKGE